MRPLDRYLLKEIAVPFWVSVSLFFVVVSFAQVLKVSNSAAGLTISPTELLWALLYSFPPLMGVLVPVSALFATLIGIGRLTADGEAQALFAAGISPLRLLKIPLCLAIVGAVVTGIATMVGEPWGLRGLSALLSSSAERVVASGMKVEEFNEPVPGVMLFARARDNHRLSRVFFADHRQADRPLALSAESATVAANSARRELELDMSNGTMLLPTGSGQASNLMRFDSLRYRLDVESFGGARVRGFQAAQGMGMADLYRSTEDLKLPMRRRARRTVIFHRKLALPLGTLIFVALAVPLGLRSGSAARARAFLLCALVVGSYYYLGRVAELDARAGGISAALAAWLPNIVGIMVLGWLLPKMVRRCG